MVKSADFLVNLGKLAGNGKKATTEELLNLIKNAEKRNTINTNKLQNARVTENIEKAFKEAEIHVPADVYKQFILKMKSLDPAAVRRFRTEISLPQLDAPLPLKPLGQLSHIPTREEFVSRLTSLLEKKAPKTKEEAFERLNYAVKELQKRNVQVSEEIIQIFRDGIIKKFGG